MTNENRTPAGVPTGGQFAASVKDEATGVALTEQPNGYAWSDDIDLVSPPQDALDFVADAEAAGMRVDVDHEENDLSVTIEQGKDIALIEWTKRPSREPAPRPRMRLFRTTPAMPPAGVRFNFANVMVDGHWSPAKDVQDVRERMGLVPHTPVS